MPRASYLAVLACLSCNVAVAQEKPMTSAQQKAVAPQKKQSIRQFFSGGMENGPQQELEKQLGRPLKPEEKKFVQAFGQARATAFMGSNAPAQACPNAMPNARNKYAQKALKLSENLKPGKDLTFGRTGMVYKHTAAVAAYAPAAMRQYRYWRCGLTVVNGAGRGQWSRILKKAGKKHMTLEQYKQAMKKMHKEMNNGQENSMLSMMPDTGTPAFPPSALADYGDQAFTMAFRGTDFEDATRKLFCQCLDKYLDYQSGK